MKKQVEKRKPRKQKDYVETTLIDENKMLLLQIILLISMFFDTNVTLVAIGLTINYWLYRLVKNRNKTNKGEKK